MVDGKAGNEGYRTGPYLSGRFLIVPSTARGNGTGHCKRSIHLLKNLQNAYIYIPEKSTSKLRGLDELKELFADVELSTILTSLSGPSDFSIVITDMRKTDKQFFRTMRHKSRIIGIDEGGSERNRFDYCIDTLPVLPNCPPANVSSPYFLDLPEHRRDNTVKPGHPLQVLIVFGGEDPLQLTGKTAAIMQRPALRQLADCSVVFGPLASRQQLPERVHVIEKTDNLKEKLADFDIVITGFGLTAYEAAAAGCGVLCVNPSRYHHKLAGVAGFIRAGLKRPGYGTLRACIKAPEKLISSTQAVFSAPTHPQVQTHSPLAAFIGELDFSAPPVCPVCGTGFRHAVHRDEDKTIWKCGMCRLYYQIRFRSGSTAYNEEYFFTEYKKQYGRTYLEDFGHIKSMGELRLRKIHAQLPGACRSKRSGGGSSDGCPLRLLDIGCAYGAFLSAAAEEGFAVHGMDISPEAVSYVRNTLAFPAEEVNFEQLSMQREGTKKTEQKVFDVISMWFVLEHFQHTGRVLKKVCSLLADDGVFAFSTPNGSGISRRSGARNFFSSNPEDHFTIWTPAAAKSVLPRFGLNVVKIKITGHHPERFPWMKRSSGAEGRGVLSTVTLWISKLFRLGDTFEVYAVKKTAAGRGSKRNGHERKST